MGTQTNNVKYVIFDIETVPDGNLIARTKYPGEGLSDDAAVEKAQQEAAEKSWSGSDFLPYAFHVPVCLGIAKVGADFSLVGVAKINNSPANIAQKWWAGITDPTYYGSATLVSFNGRGFDIPVLEMAAFRHAVPVPNHFTNAKFGLRYRYTERHIDLQEFFTNFGAVRPAGGLNLVAKLIGCPGKTGVKGSDVLSMHREGRHDEIAAYCMADVLDTYMVFLRTRVMTGELPREQEPILIEQAIATLRQSVASHPYVQKYLDCWTDRNQ